LTLCAVAAAAAVITACGGGGQPGGPAQAAASVHPPEQVVGPPRPSSAQRPNIVFVLTDDLSTDLLRFMPNVRRLARDGTSFSHYIVASSNCCPSRSSILTGQLPHNTGVVTNIRPDGGNFRFRKNGNQNHTFAVALRRHGYRTALMGKYLNGYAADRGEVPPGWTDWAGTDNGYNGYRFTLNESGAVRYYGYSSYVTDVLSDRAHAFVRSAVDEGRPFMLELSTFAPHAPAIPARRDSRRLRGLRAPRGPAFDKANLYPPPWLAGRRPLKRPRRRAIDFRYRQRARSVLAVDRVLGRLRRQLEAEGVADTTYVVFSSDNGFHMGEHRLAPGKFTAFDSDIRVPLIVAGPRVRRGQTVDALAQNIDLAPTFIDLAGGRVPDRMDGRSVAPWLFGRSVPDWRRAAILEHDRGVSNDADPDEQKAVSGNPPTYTGLRLPRLTYVEYVDGVKEFYDLRRDPAQLTNLYGFLSPQRRRELSRMLARLTRCAGADQCSTR
jgi:arylsulfatase A-like enzyme